MKCRILNSLCIVAAIVCVVALLPETTWAAPTSERQAEKAVMGWLKTDARPLGMVLDKQVMNIDTFSDTDGQPIYYVVYLQPCGYVIVPADDVVEPIIAFASGGTFDPSLDNPLGTLVSRDLPKRIGKARAFQAEIAAGRISKKDMGKRQKALENAGVKARGKWAKLHDYALPPDEGPLDEQLNTISDIRVEPLVQSRWSQDTECSENCYNYYTPNNYVCGCVATAMAQLMRYYQYPAVGIGVHTFDITVDGTSQTADTRGGDGLGGPYNWTNMVLDPECSNYTDARWEAIGALCYDAGVTVNMSYASGGSGASMLATADAFKDTFGYSNAVKGANGGINDIGPGLVGMVNPNLDAGYPTLFGVGTEGGGSGHAIMCDGYGYNASTMYHHLNMGWAGSYDAWYNLPDILDYDVVRSCIYNVFVTDSGEIISGRVTDLYGNPIEGAIVTAQGAGGPYIDITDEKGIYALAKVQSNSTYTVSAVLAGYYFEDQVVITGISVDDAGTSGNWWGVDFASTTDTITPQPNPAQWEIEPKATGLHTIAMEAKEASDEAGVEYFFECVTDADFSSDWQDSSFYVRGDFAEGAAYTFRVKARDKSDNQNETGLSDEKSAATGSDTDPCSPFPDPARWDVKPKVIRLDPTPRVRMSARVASDENGPVEYFFRCIDENPPKSDPNIFSSDDWQSSAVYTLETTSLFLNSTYTFTVKARDVLSNETAESNHASVGLTIGGAGVLTVPEPYATIQAAIDAAVSGDVVEVRTGTYTGPGNRDLDFGGNAITVKSIDPNDPAVVAATIINCGGTGSGLANDSHRAFDFNDCENADSIVAGFTIINGYVRVDGVNPVPFPPGSWGNPGTDSLGGAISCTNNSSPTIRRCTINSCTAEGGWGTDGADGDSADPNGGGTGGDAGVALGGAIYCDGTSSPTIKNCTISNCRAIAGTPGDGGDGVVNVSVGGAGGSVVSTTLVNSVSGGGAIFAGIGSSPLIINCTIADCEAVSAEGGHSGVPFTADGAGIMAFGGGVYFGLGAGIPGITNTTFNINTADNRGGGIYFAPAGATTVTLTDCDISNNSTDGGGGIYCLAGAGSALTLNNCNINNNFANLGNAGGIWYGAGGGTLTLNNCNVNYNSAPGNDSGGGIYAGNVGAALGTPGGGTTVDVNECTVSNNESQFGGGMCLIETNVTINDSAISDNIAWDGGGAWCYNCVTDIHNSRFKSNSATGGSYGAGGGLVYYNGFVTMDNCVLFSNDTDGSGGAMYFDGWAADAHLITNCLVTDNTALWDGAGLSSNLGAWVVTTNCTIADNSVTGQDGIGGGVSCAEEYAYVEIENSILWGNTAAYGPQIAVGRLSGSIFDPSAYVDVFYSDVEGGQSAVFEESGNTNVWWLAGNIDEDPCFAQTSAVEPTRNYYLGYTAAGQPADSPCIDAGRGDANDLATQVGMALTTRTDGVPDSDAVDMGYHYKSFAVPDTYLLVIIVDVESGFDPNGKLIASLGGDHSFEIEARNDQNSITVVHGAVVNLNAVPDDGFKVLQWTGADNTPAEGVTSNIVTMDSHKVVTVSFTPDGFYYLVTDVTTDNGHIEYINDSYKQVPHQGRTMHLPDEVVELIAAPDNPSHVTHWSGTNDDYTIARENTVTMNGHQQVDVNFTAPRTLDVGIDSNYPTIQLAIDDAAPGDIVKIATGTWDIYESSEGDGSSVSPSGRPYLDHLRIIDKDITITSENPDDPNSTTIFGGFVITGVSRYCVIQGLTITGRYRYADPSDPTEPPGADGKPGSPWHGGGMQLHDRDTSSGWWDIVKTYSGSPTVRNCVFRNCLVWGENGSNGIAGEVGVQSGNGGWGAWAHGGAVSCGPDSNPLFENCLFEGNLARGGHGGKGADGGDGFGPGHGGNWGDNEWYAWDYGPFKPYWKYSGYGGAVYVDSNSTAEFVDCTFTDNRVEGGSCGLSGLGPGQIAGWPYQHYKIDRFGGAVYAAGDSKPIFKDCTFIDNFADSNEQAMHNDDTPTVPAYQNISYGGAIALEGHAAVTLDGCTFSENNADVGGGIYCTYSDPNIYNCTISDNNALSGGGILCVGGSGTIERCILTGNTASVDGAIGGAIASLGANTKIIDTQIIGNYSQSSGGGIYISNKDVAGNEISGWNKVLLHNCLIAGNQAGFSGGGISANWHGYPEIENCTITDNEVSSSGYGGGLYSSYGNYATINNSILWGNTAGSGNQIAIRPTERPAAVVISYSDLQGGTIGIQPPAFGGNLWYDIGCTFNAGLGNIGANTADNPDFVTGPLGGDYYLSQTVTGGEGQEDDSPCVDAGDKQASDVELASGFTMDNYTTRTDWDVTFDAFDKAKVDMGFHYPFISMIDQCRVCDLAFDGIIDYADLHEFSLRWLWLGIECTEQNNWCDKGDFNFDNKVDFSDYAFMAKCWLTVDNKPPIPNPMEWQVRPFSTSSTAPYGISMRAAEAVDAWGWPTPQYQFKCTSDPNWNSDWQDERDYEVSGLEADTGYVFKVRARDNDDMNNITRWSVEAGAVTGEEHHADDDTPPIPNPMTWFEEPFAISDSQIGMTASTATDESGVEYGFWNTTTDEIVWQDDPDFIDTGLTAETTYTYRCAARDLSLNRNMTTWSDARSATTLAAGAEPDNEPPVTGVHANIYKADFASAPSEYIGSGGYRHTMTAVTATDATEPVEYMFICYQESGFNSDWQQSPTYDVLVSGLQSKNYYLWQVVTRDSVAPEANVGDYSDYYNCKGGVYPYP